MRVYLADLGHNQLTRSSDIYPISVANCAAYATEYLNSREGVDIRIFREPEDLKAAVDSAPPDVAGFSSYSWNHNLALQFAQYVKHKSPRTITLMGGPNYPLTATEQESWMRSMPAIDFGVRGPTYEGERAFLSILQRLVDTRCDLRDAVADPIPGNHYVHPVTGEFVRGPEVPRIEDLDEIPSPYLTGWMDPYYATGYFPMFQIARGCPFTCQFCNSSVSSNSKIHAHSVKNVCADLEHTARLVKSELPACFADDNFGMYPRDEEVADFIAYLQDKYGWPKYIRTTTGKNQADRIIRVMRRIKGALPMTSAVQSMNPQVLTNIKRANIKLETYSKIQQELRSQGMQSYGEMILCLPGESKRTFMEGVRELLETGVSRVSAHQLMLLHGAPLANPESREMFQFKTRFRLVARNIGNYVGEPVAEVEEMVVETPHFSVDDYYETRVFHLLLTIFYYEDNFEEAFQYARSLGVKPFDLVVHLQKQLPHAPQAFRKVIEDFLTESREELFSTREECEAYAKANFDGLVSGELGGNLLSKYSMIGRFFATQASIDFLEQAIASMPGCGASSDLDAVMDYLRSVLLHAPFAESTSSAPAWRTAVDVEAWRAEGYSKPLSHYQLPGQTVFPTTVEPALRSAIMTRIQMFGEHPSGLGKFTRTMFARDLRRSVVRRDMAIAAVDVEAAQVA